MNWITPALLLAYIVVFFAVLSITLWWRKRQRRTKPPFPENLRLLRMPGEHLSKRFMEGEVSDIQWLAGMMAVPILIGLFLLRFVLRLFPSFPWTGVALAGV